MFNDEITSIRDLLRIISAILPKVKNKIVQIITSHMDPDSIMSMILLSKILDSIFGKKAMLFVSDRTMHPQCEFLFKKLQESVNQGYILHPIQEIDQNKITFIVDCNTYDNRFPKRLVIPSCFIIDHHRTTSLKRQNDIFVLDLQVGACTTILYEITKFSKIRLTPQEAACAAVAIMIDTECQLLGRDLKAYNTLQSFANHELYKSIIAFKPDISRILKKFSLTSQVNGVNFYTTVEILEKSDVFMLVELARFYFGTTKEPCIVWAKVKHYNEIRKVAKGRSTNSSQIIELLQQDFGKSCGGRDTPSGIFTGGGSIPIEKTPFS